MTVAGRRLRRLRPDDVVPGAVFVVLGVIVGVFAAQEYGLFREGGRVGSGLMPFVAALSLALIGLLLVAHGSRREPDVPSEGPAQAAPPAPAEVGTKQAPPAGRTGRAPPALIILGLLAVVLVALPVVGHFATFGVFVAVVVTWLERRSLRAGIVAGISVAVVGWVIFTLLLDIPTVRGLLP